MIEKNRYSVSLVYTRNILNGIDTALRVLITFASNDEEALGKAIVNFDTEMKGFNLLCKVVIQID